MLEHIKRFWKQYIVGSVVAPVAFAAGMQVNLGAKSGTLDCKNSDCWIQVKVNKPAYGKYGDYKDAIYYRPDAWDAKTEQEITSDQDTRYNNWKQVIDTQSLATSTDETLPEN